MQPGAGNARAHRAHIKFVDLVESGSPQEVEAYWRRHVQEIDRRLLQVVDKGEELRVVDLFDGGPW
jgi:DNA-binding GntR family transcriptional regulator